MDRRRYTIKELPPELRPRERLLAEGPEALSSAELLGILLGIGTKERHRGACQHERPQQDNETKLRPHQHAYPFQNGADEARTSRMPSAPRAKSMRKAVAAGVWIRTPIP